MESLGYGPLRVPELRWLCSQRGLTPYGRKRELLARLEEQDSNDPTAQQLAECHAPGLEPFRELEHLAELALAGTADGMADGMADAADPAEAKSSAATSALATASVASASATTSATTALTAVAMAPAQAKSQAKAQAPAFVAPAQAKVPPVPPVPPIPRPEGVGLSSDERALRSLLEFFACSDVERKGQDALFNCKYREFIHSVFTVLQPDLLSGANGSLSATAAAAAAAAAACTTDTLLRSAAQQEVPGAMNSKETWSTEMWKKCMDLIENHFQVCHLQVKHDHLCEELENMNKAVLEKSEQVREVRMELDKLVEKEAQQRQQLLGRARLQLSAWVEKAEDEPEAAN